MEENAEALCIDPLFLCILQGEEATAVFTLSGSRAHSLPVAEHKCQLSVLVVMGEGLPWLTAGKVMPMCTTALRTYHGAFKDPCTEPGESTVNLSKIHSHLR